MYDRIFKEEKHEYRVFLILCAASAITDIDLTDRGHSAEVEAEMISSFLDGLVSIVENDPNEYQRYITSAFTAMATHIFATDDTRDRILQTMHKEVQRMNYSHFRRMILMQAAMGPQE